MEFVLILIALVLAGGVAFAVVVLVTGNDPGLIPATVDALPADLPTDRPLHEKDIAGARFDTGLRGYDTGQVDKTMSRLAYDIGFKDELIRVLAGEVKALRDGRESDADVLRDVRLKAFGQNEDNPKSESRENDVDQARLDTSGKSDSESESAS